MLITLGIETSCDESAVALLGSEGEVLFHRLSSQIPAHAPYGGVVPELASREHLKALPLLLREALDGAQPQLIAVTTGPGLVGSLLVGIRCAAALAWARSLAFVGVNHLEGHRASPFLSLDGRPARIPPDRVLALVASGGHSSWYLDVGEESRMLARTRDDAAGECLDKVGKVLGLPYPAGPVIDRLARGGDPGRFAFRRPKIRDQSGDFSFSGLKSAAIRLIRAEKIDDTGDEQLRADFAASIEAAVVGQLLDPINGFVREHDPELITLSGGVAANTALRQGLLDAGRRLGIEVLLPEKALTTDNGVMIARAGQLAWARGERHDPRRIDAFSRKIWHPPGMRKILEARR